MLLFWFGCTIQEPPKRFEPFDYLTQEVLQKHVTEIASDSYAGRGTLEPGLDKAAEYISAEFNRLGLQQNGEDQIHYRQPFTMYRKGWSPDSAVFLHLGPYPGETEFSFAENKQRLSSEHWRIFRFSDTGSHQSDVIFAGYGITAPEYDWNDYDGLDVTDKIVLLLRREPDNNNSESLFDGTESTSFSSFRSKYLTAKKNGAKGMILVNDPAFEGESPDFRMPLSLSFSDEMGPDEDAETDPFFAVHVSLDELDERVGVGLLAEWQRQVDNGEKPSEINTPALSAQLTIDRRQQADPVELYNVVGRLPATLPNPLNEVVVVGAHFDHLGVYTGAGDTIYNGADDNASGTAAMMVLAEAFSNKPVRSRDMLFIAFSGEELGLLGSKAFVDQIDASRVQMMLNLDMIGRNADEPISIIGDGYASGLAEAIHLANNRVEIDMELSGDAYFGASDHNSFYKVNRPFMFFFTGLHEDYHQVSDHSDKLNFERMEKIVRLSYETIEPIVEGTYTPEFIHHVPWLGVKLEKRDGRLIVAEVNPDSLASDRGVVSNSQILGVAEFDDAAEMADVISVLEPGASLTMDMQHAGVPLSIEVTRLNKGFMGVFHDDVSKERRKELVLADDEGFLIRDLSETGPAANGGLQKGDIVLSINGQPVLPRTLDSAMHRIGAGQSAVFEIIRGEDRQTVSLMLGERPKR